MMSSGALRRQEIELDLRRWCIEAAVSRIELVGNDGQSFLRSPYANEYRFRLAYDVYAKTKTQTVEYPADWWQAFRAHWFPRRWLARWPVRMTRVEVVAEALFPELAPMADGHRIYYVAREPAFLRPGENK